MSVVLQEEHGGQVLYVHLTGKLTEDDYKRFTPEFERLIGEHGKIRVLMRMDDFHGWSAAALWEDIKLDFRHFSDVERIAMISDRAWEEGMAYFCKPFTTAEVRYFGHHEEDRARQWIVEGLPAPAKQPDQ